MEQSVPYLLFASATDVEYRRLQELLHPDDYAALYHTCVPAFFQIRGVSNRLCSYHNDRPLYISRYLSYVASFQQLYPAPTLHPEEFDLTWELFLEEVEDYPLKILELLGIAASDVDDSYRYTPALSVERCHPRGLRCALGCVIRALRDWDVDSVTVVEMYPVIYRGRDTRWMVDLSLRITTESVVYE